MASDVLHHIRDVYDLKRKQGRFTGEHTRALDGRVARVVSLSKRRQALRKESRAEWLDRMDRG